MSVGVASGTAPGKISDLGVVDVLMKGLTVFMKGLAMMKKKPPSPRITPKIMKWTGLRLKFAIFKYNYT